VMLLSQEYTSFSTNTASRLLMVCMVAVDNTAEIIQKFIFLTTVCNSAWTVHNGVNVANAAINLGSGTTLHLTQQVGYKTLWFLKSYLTAFFFYMFRCTCRCDSHMLHTTLRYAQNSHAVEATCI